MPRQPTIGHETFVIRVWRAAGSAEWLRVDLERIRAPGSLQRWRHGRLDRKPAGQWLLEQLEQDSELDLIDQGEETER